MLNEILNIAGLNSTIIDDIEKVCWEKVFVNVGINAFGALTRLTNGGLLECLGIYDLMREAVKEAVKIAKLKNIDISDKDYFDSLCDVAYKTSKNKSSMLQDVLKTKKTEIDYINGKIVEYANELDIEVPINETLTDLVKGLEASYFTA
jgi:2-dehydropantoate 2-reductase